MLKVQVFVVIRTTQYTINIYNINKDFIFATEAELQQVKELDMARNLAI